MIIVIIIIILLALFTFPSPISSPLGFFNLARRGVTNLKIVERDMRYDYESLTLFEKSDFGRKKILGLHVGVLSNLLPIFYFGDGPFHPS